MSYVVSYTAKQSENAQLLRSVESTSFQVASSYLLQKQPGEPEMAMAFSGEKMSYTNLTTFKLVPPTITYFEDHATVLKYRQRDLFSQTLLQYCRTHTMSLPNPKEIVGNVNLVGVHYKYLFNSRFFWEYTVVNTPFRSLADLTPPNYDRLPENLKHFSFYNTHHTHPII